MPRLREITRFRIFPPLQVLTLSLTSPPAAPPARLAMFGSIESINPFIYPLTLLGVLFLLRIHYGSKPGRMRRYVLLLSSGYAKYAVMGLAAVSVLGFIVFEVYFLVYECAVSDDYTDDVIMLAKRTMDVLRRNTPFWFDYASLLCVIRSNYNSWDHDQDFSIMYPGDEELARLMDRFREEGLGVVWDESRDLLQIHRADRPLGNNSPHVDIWAWREDFDRETGKRLIVTADYTVTFRWRDWDLIFPLDNMEWQGMEVPVPHDAHEVSRREFDVYGGSYLTPQVFRGDCSHNFFNGRWGYAK